MEFKIARHPKIASSNILEMLDNSYIKCYSGKKIKCEIDTICIHGDGDKALLIAENLKNSLLIHYKKTVSDLCQSDRHFLVFSETTRNERHRKSN